MKISVIVSAVSLTVTSGMASAGWLDDAFHGKLPSAPDAGLCVVNPAACVANETIKESQRQHQIEQENQALRQANARNSALLQQIALKMNSSRNEERQKYRSILSSGQICFANAVTIPQMDQCYSNVQASFLAAQDSDDD